MMARAFGQVSKPATDLKIAESAALDPLIAATALVHGMTMVTRNVADFKPTGVTLINPWEASQPFLSCPTLDS
jgi:predicted nucleic acid-binding protein